MCFPQLLFAFRFVCACLTQVLLALNDTHVPANLPLPHIGFSNNARTSMPRRNRAQDLDFEIHVDKSCLSEPTDDYEMEKEEHVPAVPETDELEQLKKEIDNTINDMNDSKDIDTEDVETPKVEVEADPKDDTPLAEPIDLKDVAQDDDAHHSDKESEGTNSRRASLESAASSAYSDRHRRTSRRTEALIQAAARDIVTQIEANRGRESMNTMTETDESFISQSEGSGRPSDAHSLAESRGRSLGSPRESFGPESVHSEHQSAHEGIEDSYVSLSRPGSARPSDTHSIAESGCQSVHSGRQSIGSHHGSHRASIDSHHESIHSHQDSGSPRASIESHDSGSHRQSVHSHQDSGSHRPSLDSHRESIHSHGDSINHPRESIDSHHDSVHSQEESGSHRASIDSRHESVHSRQSNRSHNHRGSGSHRDSVNSVGEHSRAGSARLSDGHRSVGSHHSTHSTEDERTSSRNDHDDDVFSDHSPRSSMGSLSDSDQKKLDKMMSVRSSCISDISQYDREDDFVPTIRGAPRPAFRSPSSVKALQMSSPPQSVYGSPRSTRRGMPTVSRLGSPSLSAQYSPKKTPPRFRRATPPLVLLHVTLLPLRWGWGDVLERAGSGNLSDDAKVVRDAWLQLQDRMGDTTVERGILLPHPQSDYEILEERLLEALELPVKFRARILSCGHYLGPSNEASLDDSDSEEDEYDDDRRGSRRTMDMSHWCKTCGRNIKLEARGPPNKVFRVKVYASNGLMKAGAWEACWKEMERVDVEIEPLVEPAVQEEMNRLEVEQERELEERERELEMQEEYEAYSDQELSEPEYEELHEETLQHHEDVEDVEPEELELEEPEELIEPEEPIEEPIEEPVEEPVEEPLEQPMEEPIQEPIEEPIEEPRDLHEDLHETQEDVNVGAYNNVGEDLEQETPQQDVEEERSEQNKVREASFMEHTSRVPTPEPHVETPEEQQRRDEERFREIYGHAPHHDPQAHAYEQRPAEPMPNYPREAPPNYPPSAHPQQAPRDLKNASLSDLLMEAARVVMQDKKNVIIGLLSVLILMLALRGGQPQSDPRHFQTVVVSPEVSTVTVTHVPVQDTPSVAPIENRVEVAPSMAIENRSPRRAPTENRAPRTAPEKGIEMVPRKPIEKGIEVPGMAPFENGIELAGAKSRDEIPIDTYESYASYESQAETKAEMFMIEDTAFAERPTEIETERDRDGESGPGKSGY